jgi:hypothetical protein
MAGSTNAETVEWKRIDAPDPDNENELLGFTWLFGTASDTLLGTAGSNLYRSTDRGKTWRVVTYDGSNDFGGTPEARLQLPNGRIFVSIKKEKRLYRSDDDGLTWTLCTFPDLSNDNTSSEGISIASGGAHDVAVATDTSVLISHDAGETFTSYPFSPSVSTPAIAVDRYGTVHLLGDTNPTRLLHMHGESGLWFDTQNGKGSVLDGHESLYALKDGTMLALPATNQSLLRSLDYGVTWTELTDAPHHFMMLERPKGSLVSLGGTQLATSTDFGTRWQPIAFPTGALAWRPTSDGSIPSEYMAIKSITGVAMAQLSDGTVFISLRVVASMWASNQLFMTKGLPDSKAETTASALERPSSCTDGLLSSGEERIDCGEVCGPCEDWFIRDSRGWDCMYLTPKGSLLGSVKGNRLRSVDSGRTWTATTTTEEYCNYTANADVIYAIAADPYGTRKLVVSNDDGATFAPAPDAKFPGGTESLRIDGKGALYSIAYDDYLKRSTDGGKTWLNLMSVFQESTIAIDGQGDLLFYELANGSFFRLSADGTTLTDLRWSAKEVSLWSMDQFFVVGDALYTVHDKVLYRVDLALTSATKLTTLTDNAKGIVTDGNGTLVVMTETDVHVSKDNGATWKSRTSGLSVKDSNSRALVGILPTGEVGALCRSEWLTSRVLEDL